MESKGGNNNQQPNQPRQQKGGQRKQSRKDRNSAQNKISRKIITDFAESYVTLPYYQKTYVSRQILPLLIDEVSVKKSAVLTGHSVQSQNQNDDSQQNQGESNHQNNDGRDKTHNQQSQNENKKQRARQRQRMRRRRQSARVQFYKKNNPDSEYTTSLNDAIASLQKGKDNGSTIEALQKLKGVVKASKKTFLAQSKEFCSQENKLVECAAFVEAYLVKIVAVDQGESPEEEEQEGDEDDEEG